jgi:hypothetical protein
MRWMGARLVATAGLVLTILTGSVAAHHAFLLALAPAAPALSTVVLARDEHWVVLDGIRLDCATQTVRRGDAFVMASDAAGQHPFLVELAGTERCKEAGTNLTRLDGAFLGRFSRAFLRERQRLELPPGKKLRVFSERQAPLYLWRSLGAWLPWLAAGLLLLFVGIRGVWKAGG